ncbi:MAG TPA: transposase [Pirellulales bacterium]|nr:transposase [Pirellulales bacterium]
MTTELRFDDDHEPIWRISDEAWKRIYPILLEDSPPRKGPGRKPADWRRVLNGIVYRLRTGCHWNKLPKEFGDDSTIHRWYQRWSKNGVLSRVLSELRGEWQEPGEVQESSPEGSLGRETSLDRTVTMHTTLS